MSVSLTASRILSVAGHTVGGGRCAKCWNEAATLYTAGGYESQREAYYVVSKRAEDEALAILREQEASPAPSEPAPQKCCKYDYDKDGNCHIHSAPGVLRNSALAPAPRDDITGVSFPRSEPAPGAEPSEGIERLLDEFEGAVCDRQDAPVDKFGECDDPVVEATYQACRAALMEEIGKLRGDAERLEWYEANMATYCDVRGELQVGGFVTKRARTLREYIDAARSAPVADDE